jgi:hypothetical protein
LTAYAFPNGRVVQSERLRLLATLLDDGTFRLLERVGVQPGWRCPEVGAGSGSVAAWLCDRTAAGGSVLATDLAQLFVPFGVVDRSRVCHGGR